MNFVKYILLATCFFTCSSALRLERVEKKERRQEVAIDEQAFKEQGETQAYSRYGSNRTRSPTENRAIPNRLVFNYKVDLLEHPQSLPAHAKNIKSTIALYNDMEIEFLDNAGCYEAIKAAHSESLANHYRNEEFGPYKSDLCRLAQLAVKGGYYVDNDLEAISDMRLLIPPNAAFVSAAHPDADIFQAIIGVAPGHPIIMRALNNTYLHYEHAGPELKLYEHAGPIMVRDAYKWWAKETVKTGVRHHADRPSALKDSFMFIESDAIETFGLGRRHASGCCCNYVVADQESKKAAFYSRFVGAGGACDR